MSACKLEKNGSQKSDIQGNTDEPIVLVILMFLEFLN